MTSTGPDDVPRSPTGSVPQRVIDEAAGLPPAPTQWRAAPNTYAGDGPTSGPRRWRGRIAASTLDVATLLVGVLAWTGTGHDLWPATVAPRAAARPSPTVTAPRNLPPAGLGEGPAALGTPAAPIGGASDSYRFSVLQRGSAKPVAFSPCRPIHYVVRRANTPPGGDAVITRAIVAVSEATGLRFVFDGPTTEAVALQREPYQPDRYGDRWAPVLIAYATIGEVPDFGVDIAGEAGAQQVRRLNGQSVYVTGEVYLDAKEAVRMRRNGDRGLPQSVVEHELGHLVGLANVNDKSQLMFPRASRTVLAYGAGDLAGLAELGRGACAPDV